MPTPTSHYTQANSLRLRYLESGTPDPNVPPILLLPELGKTHRAIALDLPGDGLSHKPLDVPYDFRFFRGILNGLLDALGIEETNLVMHYLGGRVGLYWETRDSQRASQHAGLPADLVGAEAFPAHQANTGRTGSKPLFTEAPGR